MSTDLMVVPAIAAALPELPRVGPLDLYLALLADATKGTTRKARTQDVGDLARFLRCTPQMACVALISGRAAEANAIAAGYRTHLLERKLAAATINRRLSTLRELLRLARKYQLVDFTIEVEGLPVEPYRDTHGPGKSGWLRIFDAARKEARRCDQGKRDLAIVLLLHDHALRRGELVTLDLEHYEDSSGRLWIQGKGRTQREPIGLNNRTTIALGVWIQARGASPGPLFTRLDRARPKDVHSPLDGDAIYEITQRLGRMARITAGVRPHGLRHQGITETLELNGGNIRATQRFARHKDPRVTMRYDDNTKDLGAQMAKLLEREG